MSGKPARWLEYYKAKGRLVSVNGDLPVDEVAETIFRRY